MMLLALHAEFTLAVPPPRAAREAVLYGRAAAHTLVTPTSARSVRESVARAIPPETGSAAMRAPA